MQQIFHYKISDNKRYSDPDQSVTIAHSDAEFSLTESLYALCDHKIQVKEGRVRYKRVIPGRLQKAAVQQCADGSCTAAPGAVITADQVKPAGRQPDAPQHWI